MEIVFINVTQRKTTEPPKKPVKLWPKLWPFNGSRLIRRTIQLPLPRESQLWASCSRQLQGGDSVNLDFTERNGEFHSVFPRQDESLTERGRGTRNVAEPRAAAGRPAGGLCRVSGENLKNGYKNLKICRKFEKWFEKYLICAKRKMDTHELAPPQARSRQEGVSGGDCLARFTERGTRNGNARETHNSAFRQAFRERIPGTPIRNPSPGGYCGVVIF